jgi:hypothetical protein
VDEQREDQAELVVVEDPLRFTDHHRVEPTLAVLQRRAIPAARLQPVDGQGAMPVPGRYRPG